MSEIETHNSGYEANAILRHLSRQELNQLAPQLERVNLPVRHVFNQPHQEIRNCYFITSGMTSTVAIMQDGSSAEIGVIGTEGLVGFQALLGVPFAAHQTIMQVAGAGYCIEPTRLRQLTEELPNLRHAIERFTWASLAFYGQCAACNRFHSLEERLCRWLLIVRDRIHGNTLPLTHEFLGHMLGAHRSTVTLALGSLERSGLIQNLRGRIHLLNIENLEAAACECYQVLRNLPGIATQLHLTGGNTVREPQPSLEAAG